MLIITGPQPDQHITMIRYLGTNWLSRAGAKFWWKVQWELVAKSCLCSVLPAWAIKLQGLPCLSSDHPQLSDSGDLLIKPSIYHSLIMTSCLKFFPMLLLLSLLTAVLCRPGARARCDFGARQFPEPQDCLHGWVTTPCGGRVCRKGPGGVCGGSQAQYGVCGEGLQCSDCNRCTGCSYRLFRCYSDHDKCASSDDSFL